MNYVHIFSIYIVGDIIFHILHLNMDFTVTNEQLVVESSKNSQESNDETEEFHFKKPTSQGGHFYG